jgi:hypothetical protein
MGSANVMTVEKASAVYDVLVAIAGAHADRKDAFVGHFSSPGCTNEWRFGGKLGSGGKFRYPRMTVDCYPEDGTHDRLTVIRQTNAALAAFR